MTDFGMSSTVPQVTNWLQFSAYLAQLAFLGWIAYMQFRNHQQIGLVKFDASSAANHAEQAVVAAKQAAIDQRVASAEIHDAVNGGMKAAKEAAVAAREEVVDLKQQLVVARAATPEKRLGEIRGDLP